MTGLLKEVVLGSRMEDVTISEERQTRRRQAGSRLAHEHWAYTREGVSLLPLLGSEAKQTKKRGVVCGSKEQSRRWEACFMRKREQGHSHYGLDRVVTLS